MEKHQVIIMGAGLAGLTLAYRLKQQGINALVLESRDRLGGRILTVSKNGVTLELGATWFADKHQQLNNLLDELELEKIEQQYGQYAIYEMAGQQPVLYPLPQQPEATYRIKGGSQVIIDKLASQLDADQIHLDESVEVLDFSESYVKISTESAIYEAAIVINTLPPNLMVSRVNFQPALPDEWITLSKNTHTWMGESIKLGFYSDSSFWAEKNIGTIYSQTGPITEMYDHSNEKGFAMKGFLNDRLKELTEEERETRVRVQLAQFFEEESLNQIKVVQKVWKHDAHTYAAHTSDVFPHQNNGHPTFRAALYGQRFYLAGSETATTFPGYMDGAVEAANRVAEQVRENLGKVRPYPQPAP